MSRKGVEYWLIKVEQPDVWEYEHRIVMAKTLGRPLKPGEVVHHLNHNSLDNDPDNLMVESMASHTAFHHTMQVGKWAKNYDCCAVCGTTSKKHLGKGLCSTCYQQQPGQSWKDKYAKQNI